MKKLIIFMFILILLGQKTTACFAISPKTQFPSQNQVALSLIEDLLEAASLDFKEEQNLTVSKTKPIQKKRPAYKNPYRNMFYYYGMLYGSSSGGITPVSSTYRASYNNYRHRSAYGIPVNQVAKSANSQPVKRFDLFFHGNGEKTTPISKETQKKDQFIPGEALSVLDSMQKEFENMFLNENHDKIQAKLATFKNALTLVNRNIAAQQNSRVINAYEKNSRNKGRNETIFIIRAFLTTVIAKMEDKINMPINNNEHKTILAAA